MMQNSLDRIFAGLDHTLRNVVAPTITDPYVRSQLASVIEILANLSTRVEWNCTQLLEVSLRIRSVLELAATSTTSALPHTTALLARPAPTASCDNEALLHARTEHLLALREVQRSLQEQDGTVAEALRDFLAWQVATEMSRVRTGMFSASKGKDA